MINVSKIVLLVVLAVIVGTVAFLATWDMPAPSAEVERVIPDDRFPQ